MWSSVNLTVYGYRHLMYGCRNFSKRWLALCEEHVGNLFWYSMVAWWVLAIRFDYSHKFHIEHPMLVLNTPQTSCMHSLHS